MGESASARTQRELADLRSAIDRDIDTLVDRVREDVDPRNLVRRNPIAVAGSLGSLAAAAAVGMLRRERESRRMYGAVDVLVERFGGRIDKLKGKPRKTFRKQLRKEMAEVGSSGPQEAVWGAVAAGLTALATTVARGFGQRLVGDEGTPSEPTSER